MLLEALWSNKITLQFVNLDNSKNDIEKLLELLDHFYENDICIYINEEQIYSDENFCQWLYEKRIPEINDMKREIQIKMSKSVNIDNERYDEIFNKNQMNMLKLNFDESKLSFLYTISKLFKIKQMILKTETKAEFKEDLKQCFQNIHFDDTVKSSINTLNRNFDKIKNEIVDHLIAIDGQAQIFKKSQRKSNDEIAATFFERTGIECSSQAGRSGVAGLKRNYYNEQKLADEEICCELHTKFDKHGIDPTKQDRIYFFPGCDGIMNGKIIVVHIGKHL